MTNQLALLREKLDRDYKDQWTSDITVAHLAATYSQLKMDKEGYELLGYARDLPPISSESDYCDELLNRATSAVRAVLRNFIARLQIRAILNLLDDGSSCCRSRSQVSTRSPPSTCSFSSPPMAKGTSGVRRKKAAWLDVDDQVIDLADAIAHRLVSSPQLGKYVRGESAMDEVRSRYSSRQANSDFQFQSNTRVRRYFSRLARRRQPKDELALSMPSALNLTLGPLAYKISWLESQNGNSG